MICDMSKTDQYFALTVHMFGNDDDDDDDNSDKDMLNEMSLVKLMEIWRWKSNCNISSKNRTLQTSKPPPSLQNITHK